MRCATPEVPICGLFEADPEIDGVPHGTRWANIAAVVDNGAAKLVAPLGGSKSALELARFAALDSDHGSV